MERIRILRKQKGMTMKELGKAVGVTEAAISHYETGKREPDGEILISIASTLGVSIDYLMGREDTKKEPAVDLSGFDPDIVEAMRDVRPEEKAAVLALISGLKASRKE